MVSELVDKAGMSNALNRFLSFTVILCENFVLLVVGRFKNKKSLYKNQARQKNNGLVDKA
jgi:hypothetical protein